MLITAVTGIIAGPAVSPVLWLVAKGIERLL